MKNNRTVLTVALVCVFSSWCQGQERKGKLKGGTPEKTPAAKASEAAKDETGIVNSLGMKLALIPAGEFLMGSPEGERSRSTSEQQRKVRIAKPFYLGVYEVTQAEFEKAMGKNPSRWTSTGEMKDQLPNVDTSRFPVENVSGEQAVEFCQKLNATAEEKAAGRVYRLPTEAEWEYACRAGTTTPFHFGAQLNGKEANCGFGQYGTGDKGQKLGRPATVGSYAANEFGLYDMHGNVWEWCQDGFGEPSRTTPGSDFQGIARSSYRVIRGGSWGSFAEDCRAAFRSKVLPASRNQFLGFRVAAVTPALTAPPANRPAGM